ncbi:MAG: hypothetical protein R3F13_21965 [Prosthecobacter sp.]
MINLFQSSARASGVDDADVQAAYDTANAGGISPVQALVESGAVDERGIHAASGGRGLRVDMAGDAPARGG